MADASKHSAEAHFQPHVKRLATATSEPIVTGRIRSAHHSPHIKAWSWNLSRAPPNLC